MTLDTLNLNREMWTSGCQNLAILSSKDSSIFFFTLRKSITLFFFNIHLENQSEKRFHEIDQRTIYKLRNSRSARHSAQTTHSSPGPWSLGLSQQRWGKLLDGFWIQLRNCADLQEFATCILTLDGGEPGHVLVDTLDVFGHVPHDLALNVASVILLL